MPSQALSKLRSAGSEVLSSLPQGSASFSKVVSRSGGAAHSRSTSAGSSSDGRSSQDLQKSALCPAYPQKSAIEEDSLFSTDIFGISNLHCRTLTEADLSRQVSLEEYHAERESIRSLKKYYEECQVPTRPDRSIGLPPGLEDPGLAVHQCAELVSAYKFEAPQLWSPPLQQPLDDHDGEQFNSSGRPFKMNANAEPFDATGQMFGGGAHSFKLDANAQPFIVTGQQFDASSDHSLDVAGSLDVGGQQVFGVEPFNVSGEPFDMNGESFDVGGEAFDVVASGQEFNLSGYLLDGSGQQFDVEMPWFPSTLDEQWQPSLSESLTESYEFQAAQQPLVFDGQQGDGSDLLSTTWDAQPAPSIILSTPPPLVY